MESIAHSVIRGLWAVALLGTSVGMAPAALGQKARSIGQVVVSPKIDPRVSARAQSQTPIRVFVVLTDQPQAGIFQQVEAANALSQQIAESQYRRVAGQPFPSVAELSQAGAAVDAVVLATRQQAFQAIEQAIKPEQDAMESRLASWGATHVLRYQGINMLAAEIPAAAIAQLEADPSVAEVFPVEVRYAELATSVPALGAPTFWTAGYTGQGQSVGVLDTGARTNHPAFGGKIVSNVFLTTASTDSCFADNASSGEDQEGHGTHVTGIVMSQGSAGWTNYQGVAKGVDTLYNLKVGFSASTAGTCGGGGESFDSDVLAGIDWAVKNTALKVLNYSFGGTASGDDDSFTRSIDKYIDTYGLTIAIAAGNDGPGGHTVGSPGIAYNSITAANWISRGTIASSSSRGPTNGGRYKPDLAAPGSTIYSANYRWDNSSGTGDDFVAMTGTSMASPHLAGSAAVLRSAGISNELEVKAVLINTTDNTGWAADRGWGYTNLTTAYQEMNYATGSLAAGGFQLYKLTPSGTAQATVTWNRHVSGSTSNFNDINLYLFRADTGAQLSSSATTLQNVEQVSATYSGDAVVAVDMATSSLAGVSSEPYAVAFNSAASALTGPSLSPSCSLPSSIPAGSQFTLSCTATNSGDLTAFAVTAQVQLPSGFSGVATMSLGDVQAGHTSSAGNLTLNAPGAAGPYSLPVTVSSNSFGETFSGTASYTANVVGALPAPVLSAPANGATGVSQTPTLSWSASTGASSYDVYFGTASAPPLAVNTTATSYSPGTLSAGTLYYWRVVAKNTSGSNSSGTWSFTTLTPAPPAPVLFSPANGATGVMTTAAVTWNSASGATSYDVYFGTASTPPLAVNTTATSYSPGTLTAGTLYYWRIVAKNTSGSNSSATWSFTTLAAGPPAPVLSAPANGATGVSATPAVSWIAASGATSYDVYFGAASSPPLATNTAGTTYSPGTLSAGTVYYWRVVAKNAGGSNTSSTWSFTTQVAAPAAPVLSAPANGATGVSATPALSWIAASGATSYDVYFGTAPSPVLATNTTGTTYSPGTLSAGTVYYWRVVAKNAGGSNGSATWSFTTQVAAPPAPVLSAPASGATGVSATPTLSWNASSGATSYDVYFGTASPPLLATNTAGTTYSPGTLSAGTVYYWRVVAKNGGGSNTSATWSFTTQVAAPPAPVLNAPANGAGGISVVPVLSWSAATGATSYDVYFGTASSPPLVTNTAGTSYSPGTLSTGTVYYWYVVAKNVAGSSASAVWSFATIVGAPGLTSPSNGAIGVSWAPKLSWTAASGATSYDVYFGTANPPPRLSNITATSYSPGALSPGTTYYWLVVARNSGGVAPSATWSFTTQLAPPNLLGPENGAAGVSVLPTLSWSGSIGAATYDIYLGTSPSPPLVASTTETNYAAGPLAGGVLYYWRVVANGAGSSSSVTWSFKTQVAAPSGGSPTNGAFFVPSEQLLTWIPSTGATSYDVYFGTQAAPPLVTNTTDTTYNTGPLSTRTLYFWKVVARDSASTSDSPTWSFTSEGSAPPVAALRYIPVTPCRVVDTRSPEGPFGGPSMGRNELRAIAIPQSGCGIPSTAQAYSLNVTVVPRGRLSYLTLWPSGEAQPLVSTLNSFEGIVVANAAIVPAGPSGGVNVFVTDPSDVILDIDGYFDSTSGANAYSFYPATPCRIADTRSPAGAFGGPSMAAHERRDFALPSSACGLPAAAKAYSLNVTVVPDPSVDYLGYLTTWAAGQGQPNVSTLNSWTGKVVANAALVPAGTNGAVSVYVSDPTNVILDTNGYFAAPGSAGALSFYPVTPCRVVDTRGANGAFGGPILAAQAGRSFPIPAGGCGIPATAAAYSMNVTVVPSGALSFLTTWPTGAGQPFVSTLNSFDGSVVANAAIVPAGTGGAVSVFVTNQTHLILDINGYFAP